MAIKFHRGKASMKIIKWNNFYFISVIVTLRLRKNIEICLLFLSSICSGMHGTLDVQICIYQGIEVREEHISKNSVSDVPCKGERNI
jgi:hypothetical protein